MSRGDTLINDRNLFSNRPALRCVECTGDLPGITCETPKDFHYCQASWSLVYRLSLQAAEKSSEAANRRAQTASNEASTLREELDSLREDLGKAQQDLAIEKLKCAAAVNKIQQVINPTGFLFVARSGPDGGML